MNLRLTAISSVVGPLALAAFVLGCGEDPAPDDGDTANADTGAQDDPACEPFEDPGPAAISCGTYEDTDECGGDTGGGGTGDGGGSDSGGGDGGCGGVQDSNAAVVACVAQASADGVEFSFAHYLFSNGGQYDISTAYRVTTSDTIHHNTSGDNDLCVIVSQSKVTAGADFSDCTTWGCIDSRLGAAEFIATCSDTVDCDGGV